MLFEITNEAIALTGGAPISITADYFFQAASAILMTVVVGFVIVRVVEPRLGKYDPAEAGDPAQAAAADEIDPAVEARGLRRAGIAFLVVLGIVLLATLPPGAPLRDPETGAIIGQTPFMNSLLFIVMLCFLVPGIAFGSAVGKYKGPNDVIAAVVKTFAGLGVLIFTLLMISQFIAYFNYSNLPSVIATTLADWLGAAGIPAIPLLIGFVSGDRVTRFHHAGLAGQVGHLRSHLCTALHPAGRAGADVVRRLPCWRLADQHAYAVDGVLPGDRRLRPTLSEENGRRVAGGADAADCRHCSGRLAGSS